MDTLLGIVWLLIFFGACFGLVHVIRAIFFVREKPPAEETPPPPPKKESEPVYYIVEKKSRKKNTYSKPRKIKFE